MRKLVLTLFISIFCVFNMSAQTFITPNTSSQDTSLQVFISGTQSDFLAYSGCGSINLYLEVTNGWGSSISVPNNVGNWQNHASYGDGFYSTITIPNNAYLGNYDLTFSDSWCWGTTQSISNVFSITHNSDAYQQDWRIYNYETGDYTYSSNNEAAQAGEDDYLSVRISAVNINFAQFTNSYNTDYRFIYSDTLSQIQGDFEFTNNIITIQDI